MRWLRRHLTDVWRVAHWHRRALAAVFAALAVTAAIRAAQPAGVPTVPMLVAAQDVAGGVVLRADDLTTVEVTPDVPPPSALAAGDAVGEVLAGPLAAGEPVTSSRLLGDTLIGSWDQDLVAAPVRVVDAGAARLLRVGDRIDLFGADVTGTVRQLSTTAPVLTLPGDDGDQGALVVVGVPPEDAAAIAGATGSQVSFVLHASDGADR